MNLHNLKFAVLFLFLVGILNISAQSYKIVDTGEKTYFNNLNEISAPDSGESFYGQDAQFDENQPSYTNNRDGTITDNVTGLMWSQTPDINKDGVINVDDKLTYYDALTYADILTLAGYDDWRIPSIKELYSLIMFYGIDPSGYEGTSTDGLTPFINTNYFDFGYGDTDAGERIIDAQFVTTSIYVGTVMGGQKAMFGVNFADGRIKGYPVDSTPMQPDGKGFYVLFVRGNNIYGKNDFADNEDGTITDNSTGLMWQQDDSKTGMNWVDALSWVQQKNSENYLGYNDWRLPNVKELQSIVDYSRSLSTTNSAAIDSKFDCSTITDEGGETDYPFYWSGTTHENMMNGGNAAYVAFGEALGWMQDPLGNYQLMDVHGAGAQRSDPKSGNSDDYPYGHGPQGDVIRVYNYVRLVRDANTTTGIGENSESSNIPVEFKLEQNYPNPFNPTTTIKYTVPNIGNENIASPTELVVYDILGKRIKTLVNKQQPAGNYQVTFDANDLSSGVYFYALICGSFTEIKKMTMFK